MIAKNKAGDVLEIAKNHFSFFSWNIGNWQILFRSLLPVFNQASDVPYKYSQ